MQMQPKAPNTDAGMVRNAIPYLRLKIAQKPYIVWSLGPKAFKYESLEPKG